MTETLLDDKLAERNWWKDNPEPNVSRTDDRLVLWNYPIGKADLADVHAQALRYFLQELAFGVETGRSRSVVTIIGHASRTGEASMNDEIARDRAEVVGAYLRGLGFKNENLEISSGGSSHPWFPSLTPGALARNRRVEVSRLNPPAQPAPREPIDTSKRTGIPPSTSLSPTAGGAYAFKASVDWKFYEAEHGFVSVKASFVGELRGEVSGGDVTVIGIEFEGKNLSPELQAKISENLEAKVGIERGEKGKPDTLKATIEGEVWGFPIEFGLQTDPHFGLLEVSLPPVTIAEFEYRGVKIKGEFEGKVRLELGPSKALLARLGTTSEALVVAGVEVGAAASGVLIVTAVIIGGTIYAAENGKREMAEFVVEMAVRDGAASCVAYEALGATKDARVIYEQHRVDLYNLGGAPSRDGFDAGEKLVTEYLNRNKRDATTKAWTETYGKGLNAQDFDKLRGQLLFEHFDAYKNDRRPIPQAIAEL